MADSNDEFNYLSSLDTEQRNPESLHIDLARPLEIVTCINNQDKLVADAVAKKLPEIALAVEKTTECFKKGGRLFYAGSGTSGRIGIVDAAECPPTFGTDPEMVQGLIAGGPDAVFRAQEKVEDSPEEGKKAVQINNLGEHDVLCGLAASGRTPYVKGALEEAASRESLTIFICCVSAKQLRLNTNPDILIDVPVGPEVIMGSTRMKSATAQKMVCNMITTGSMIRLGKIYENVMVDLQLTNRKLEERARRILMLFSDVDYITAGKLLEKSGNHVKSALLMAVSGLGFDQATELLGRHNGFVRSALQEVHESK